MSSARPQAEAPACTPSASASGAFPSASTVAAPARRGAATHPHGTLNALAAGASGIALALAAITPAAASGGEVIDTASDGALVVVLLVAIAIVVTAAALHGRPRRVRARRVESSCCLVQHELPGEDEPASAVGER